MLTETFHNINLHFQTLAELDMNFSQIGKQFLFLPKVMGDAGVELVAGLQEFFVTFLPLQALFNPLQRRITSTDLL